MLRRLLIAGLGAGVVAGLLVTGLQYLQAVPLIHQAELYESGLLVAGSQEIHDGQAHHGHAHDHEHTEGAARVGLTLLSNLVTGVGFGLMLAAAVAVFGYTRLWQGLLWGTGGFLAFSLLPALGLPPSLPGMEQAPLADRQLWWAATAAASAVGLGILAFAPPLWVKPFGLLLLVLPHLVGAPAGPTGESLVPDTLAREFVGASLLMGALFWMALGLAVTGFYRRLSG